MHCFVGLEPVTLFPEPCLYGSDSLVMSLVGSDSCVHTKALLHPGIGTEYPGMTLPTGMLTILSSPADMRRDEICACAHLPCDHPAAYCMGISDVQQACKHLTCVRMAQRMSDALCHTEWPNQYVQ